jgi:hypothetical protein
MSHEIRIPHRDRSDPLSSVGELARHLESPDESAIVRQLVTDAAGAGLTTVGGLLDQLEAASPAERRMLVDDARRAVGLPTASALAAKASREEQSRLLSAAAGDDVELQLVPGPTGYLDVDALAVERAQARADAERRGLEHAQRRAARAAKLPGLEHEDAAESVAWRPANALPVTVTERTA